MAELDSWQYKLATAKTLNLTVNTDLERLTRRQLGAIGDAFLAIKTDDLQVACDLYGFGTMATLPLRLLKIGELKLIGDRGWLGNFIYFTWYALRGPRPLVVRLHLMDMSPQPYGGSPTGNKFTAMLITSHKALIVSQVRGHLYKAKVSKSEHIQRVKSALLEGGGDFAEVEVVVREKDKLFGPAWASLGRTLQKYEYPKFTVHESDGVHQRNRIGVHGDKMTASLYKFADFGTLPTGCETIEMYVDDAYAKRPKDLEALAYWLARRKSLRHLEIDERVGLLAQTVDVARTRKRSRKKKRDKDDGTDKNARKMWGQLETVNARLYDKPMSLAYLFKLPRTHTLRFLYEKKGGMGHQFVQKATKHGWAQEVAKTIGSMQYVRFVHKARREQLESSSSQASTGTSPNLSNSQQSNANTSPNPDGSQQQSSAAQTLSTV